jgi:hypothetical protein
MWLAAGRYRERAGASGMSSMVRLEKATVQMRGTERDAFAMQQPVRGVFAAQPFVYPR